MRTDSTIAIEMLEEKADDYSQAIYNLNATIMGDMSFPPGVPLSDDYRENVSDIIRAYRAMLVASLDFPVISVPSKYW